MTEKSSDIIHNKALRPLRVRARIVADGYRSGSHRSYRRGAGLEFAGHRAYSPGDDLRWLDHRAVLRQDRLLIKQFETETDRQLELVVDASASMGYQSGRDIPSKWQHASLLAAAMAQIALRGGDRVGLRILGEQQGHSLPASSRPATARRLADALEETAPKGDLGGSAHQFEGRLARAAQKLRRGSLLILLSDLLELPESSEHTIAALGAGGRQLAVIQVLDPLEARFELDGPVRLRSNESQREVETHANLARTGYLKELVALQSRMREAVTRHGGDFITCCTEDDPVATIRDVLTRAARRSTQ